MAILRSLCIGLGIGLGIGLAGSTCFSGSASAARALSGAGSPPGAPTTQRPAAQSPDSQVTETRIAAVVNDEAISVADVLSRLRMVMLSSNLTDSPETRQRIGAQVLRTIVDEKLQMQEAKRQNVTATDEEINKALAQIEKQNNMQAGQLDQVLKSHGIERSALVDQLTASIVWAKLVRRLVSQTSVVSDEEIDYALQRAKETANEPQSRVAEIFLAVDNPQQDDEVRRLAGGSQTVDPHNVRMRKPSHGARFGHEPGAQDGVIRIARRQRLDRYLAIERFVQSQQHVAHSTGADFSNDKVSRQPLRQRPGLARAIDLGQRFQLGCQLWDIVVTARSVQNIGEGLR